MTGVSYSSMMSSVSTVLTELLPVLAFALGLVILTVVVPIVFRMLTAVRVQRGAGGSDTNGKKNASGVSGARTRKGG